MSVRIIECTSPTELYRYYDRQSEAHRAYIEIDLPAGTLSATWDAEDSARPRAVRCGFERRYLIPVLTGEAANAVLEELRPLAERILADWEERWSGQEMVAVLGEDAAAAGEEIEKRLGLHPDGASADVFDESQLVAMWDVGHAVDAGVMEEFGITADTDDERLDAIAAQIIADLAEVSASGVAVMHGLDSYLRGLREELREQQGMSDAEFRVLRESLGLTGDWLAGHLGVSPRTVRHWEQGKYTVPYGVARALRGLEAETAGLVRETVADLREEYPGGDVPELVVYRTDEDYLASGPEPVRSASWHRAFVARVAQQIPVTVSYDA